MTVSSFFKDRKVPVCPLCNQPVSLSATENPDRKVSPSLCLYKVALFIYVLYTFFGAPGSTSGYVLIWMRLPLCLLFWLIKEVPCLKSTYFICTLFRESDNEYKEWPNLSSTSTDLLVGISSLCSNVITWCSEISPVSGTSLWKSSTFTTLAWNEGFQWLTKNIICILYYIIA